MVKRRLISCLLLQNELLVQSIGFKRYLPIGKAKIAVEFMANWDIDEILLIDMTATREGRKPNTDLIATVSRNCFVPLTVGGGISQVGDVKAVIRAGADKVSLNWAAIQNPKLITEISQSFGAQCVVVSMDVKKNAQGKYEVFANSGTEATGLDPVQWASKVESLGAGEILLNSIDRDGSKLGYDLDLIKTVADAVGIPVIACGGVGLMKHFVEGVTKAGADAVAAANIFQHVEHSTIVAKSFMAKAGVDIRLGTLARYTDFVFDDSGRILKRSDAELEQIWMERFKKEEI